MPKDRNIRVILRLNPKITAAVLGRAYGVYNGMEGDQARYSGPNPTLPVLQAQITKVEDAEKAAKTRAKGLAAARNTERKILVGMLKSECAYVQTLCDADPVHAIEIAENVGMFVAATPVRENPVLKVTVRPHTGSVELDANAAVLIGSQKNKTVFYNWQFSTDGGQTFTSAPSTTQARTIISNLTPLAKVGFRVSITDSKGQGDWSAMVVVVIL